MTEASMSSSLLASTRLRISQLPRRLPPSGAAGLVVESAAASVLTAPRTDVLLGLAATDASSDDLESAQSLDTLALLNRIAMLKDGTTAEHITRMAYIAECLGAHYGLSARQLDMLLHAAPLHDIGKIGIPDDILKKPGALTTEEMRVMQTHPLLGYELLAMTGFPALRLGAEIALYHHERWDGEGYPYKLRGSEIPLSARIVAVADVFDALTSARPYKAAWTIDRAMDHLHQQAGRHFDPDLVACLDGCLADVQRVLHTFTRTTPLAH